MEQHSKTDLGVNSKLPSVDDQNNFQLTQFAGIIFKWPRMEMNLFTLLNWIGLVIFNSLKFIIFVLCKLILTILAVSAYSITILGIIVIASAIIATWSAIFLVCGTCYVFIKSTGSAPKYETNPKIQVQSTNECTNCCLAPCNQCGEAFKRTMQCCTELFIINMKNIWGIWC